ncbi:MAG TPA: ACP S-malonyltransferase [Candidatus Kapabacteria bacterium]|jgi:[acyl-carrier-protein] S-malonyltransferase|nr:ACP S-malonyltransferase [Ignavibacteria bacterium]HRK59161.1 ACP S-malonyltransferase [Candidatus Kapabacteria bacterium]
MKKIAGIFSGQGSQYVGMAKGLTEQFSAASKLFAQADAILGYSLSSICFDGPMDILKQTRYTQPALFVHEMALLAAAENRLQFDATAGHSLGEYSAICAAGGLTFEHALRLVALRGELMYAAGESMPGTMAAIVGLDDDTVRRLCAEISDDKAVVVPANFNSPGQIVISGSADMVRQSLDTFKQAGAKMAKELPVSGAFHSPLMKPAQERLAEAITATPFSDTAIDVYTNVTALPTRRASELRQLLIEQVCAPVLWTQSLINMAADGITTFIEIGPGKVLQGLVKRTVEAEILGYDTEKDIQQLLA